MAEIFAPPSFQTQPVDFSWLANLPKQFYEGAAQKQQYDVSHAFPNGVPMVNGLAQKERATKVLAYDPLPDNQFHGEVWGHFSRALQKRLRATATWYVEIDV